MPYVTVTAVQFAEFSNGYCAPSLCSLMAAKYSNNAQEVRVIWMRDISDAYAKIGIHIALNYIRRN